MSTVTIYHNPRCSTSRKALDLLRARGIEPARASESQQPERGEDEREQVTFGECAALAQHPLPVGGQRLGMREELPGEPGAHVA